MKQKVAVHVHDLKFSEFISEETIQSRIAELGAALTEKYKGKNPLFIGILNGAFVFLADLVRVCLIDCESTFVKLSSYEGLSSSGEVKTKIGLSVDIKGRPVIIVEDIIDTGRTLSEFIKTLEELEPESIEIVSLLVKPEAIQHEIKIDYFGFEIPPKFVVGYGLDYNGLGRNLRSIYQLDE